MRSLPSRQLKWLALGIGLVLLVAFLFAPLGAIIPVSFSQSSLLLFPPEELSLSWYYRIFQRGVWLRGFLLTAVLSVTAAAVSVTIGFSTAYWLELAHPKFHKSIPIVLFLPVIIPAPIMALAYYVALNLFLRWPPFFSILLAYSFSGVPYAFLAARLGFLRFPILLEEASMLLGASSWQAFFWIRLRASSRYLLSGFLLAIFAALDDVIFAFFLADAKTRPLNLLLYDGIRTSLSPIVAAASTLLFLIGLLIAIPLFRSRSPVAYIHDR